MFGFSKPKIAVELYNKAWVEWRWKWLGKTFGWQPLLNSKIFLPEDIPCCLQNQLSQQDVQAVFEFIASTMGVKLSRVKLIIETDNLAYVMEDAVGLYEPQGISKHPHADRDKSTITLAHTELSSPIKAVSTLAHELAHEVLLGRKLIKIEESDNEWLTDLLPVFFGYGLFLANDTVRDSSYSEGSASLFQISRKGYLPSRVFGHALALFAWLRKEDKPDWSRHLRPDARQSLKQSLRYLKKTNDALVQPDLGVDSLDRERLTIDKIRELSPTKRLGLLWDIDDSKNNHRFVEVATVLIGDSEAEIRQEVLMSLYGLRELSVDAIAALRAVVLDKDPFESMQACSVLLVNDSAPQEGFDVVRPLLTHFDRQLNRWAAFIIGQLSTELGLPDDPKLYSSILVAMDRSLRSDDEDKAFNLFPAFIKIPDLHHTIRQYTSSWGEERVNALIDFSVSNPDSSDGPLFEITD